MRRISKRYNDPLELVWLYAAKEIGFKIVRDPEVFASWDGKGTLKIGSQESLDPDDCLAQMIFHEICHALIEGPDSIVKEDWGLNPDMQVGAVNEHACLRLQAALADQFGLRQFFAATTDFRSYFDELGNEPLIGEADPAAELALKAWTRANEGPWASPIKVALEQTRAILDVVKSIAPSDSLWACNRI